MDPSSRELLDMVVERVARLRLLLLITYRPEFVPPWTGQSHVSTLILSRLGRREGAELVGRVVGNDTLPDEIIAEIVERTDGVPLFVEELTKAVLEASGHDQYGERTVTKASFPTLAVPASLHASLMARLDRLGIAAKEIAQIGATIGREFSYELLIPVAQRSDADLQDALGRLSNAGLVLCRGKPPQATFVFKHALVRDVAYECLLRGQRQQFHARIASMIEQRFPEIAAQQPELLAHHLTEAGSAEEAVGYWIKAGKKSCARFALAEAVAQLRKGLALLRLLSEGPARWRHELELQIALGWSLFPLKGEEAPEAGEVFVRARELCDQLGDRTSLGTVLFMQGAHYIARAEFTTARDTAEQLLHLAIERGDAALEILGHLTLGRSLHFLGEFVSAAEHIQRVLNTPVPHVPHQSWSYVPVGYSRTIALSYLAFELMVLGHPHQAVAAIDEALKLGKAGDPYALVVTLSIAAFVNRLRGAQQEELEYLAKASAVASEQRFPLPLARAKLGRARVLAKEGKAEEGLARARQAYGDLVATGSSIGRTITLSALAYCCEKAGKMDEALELLDTALERASATNERYYEAELHRSRGECLLAQGHRAQVDAEASLRHAINVAQRQNAKLWELRASTSLARLWRDQGKRTEARDLLAPIYGWFTEGFDTPDLTVAKALLEELG